jgi:hypothetical protein
MMKKKPQKVFLDANLVIQAGKPPGGLLIKRVRDLVDAHIISVLTTDLTITEVAKKHAENDYEVIKEIGRPHFRKTVSAVIGSTLPDITKADLRARLRRSTTNLRMRCLKRSKPPCSRSMT